MKARVLVLIIILSVIIFCFNGLARAGRPFSTEDATVAKKDEVQTEISVDVARQKNKDAGYTFTIVPIYGLTKNLEFSAEMPFDIQRPKEGQDQEGVTDITLVLKTLIFTETENLPSILIKATAKLANGNENKGLGSGDEDFGFILAATKNFVSFTLHANLGYTFVGQEKDPTLDDYLGYGIAIQYPFTEKLAIAAEVYGESNSHFDIGAFKHHALNPLFGFTYNFTKELIFDAGFKINVHDKDKEGYGITAGFSFAF